MFILIPNMDVILILGFFGYNRRIWEEYIKQVSDHFMPRGAWTLSLVSAIFQCFLEQRKKKKTQKQTKEEKSNIKACIQIFYREKKIFFLLQKICFFLNGIRTRLTELKEMVDEFFKKNSLIFPEIIAKLFQFTVHFSLYLKQWKDIVSTNFMQCCTL